jgi:hypothetical protein
MQTAASTDLFCPHCGYNQRGLEGDRCPECGGRYQRAELSASRIAWTSRRQIGRVSALVRTVLTASFQPRLLAASVQADLLRRDARWFVILCTLPLAALLSVGLLQMRLDQRSYAAMAWLAGGNSMGSTAALWSGQLFYPWCRGVAMPAVLIAMAVAITRVLGVLPVRIAAFPRYPVELRERMLTASHYLVGSLVGGSVTGALLGAALWLTLVASGLRGGGGNLSPADLLPTTVALFSTATAIVLWAIACVRFHHETERLSGTHAPTLLLAAALLCMLGLLAAAVALPWSAGLLHLIVHTLRG